jgi:hypothetical protein
MFKTKALVLASIFIGLLLITSVIKNKTRVIEKKILNLQIKITSKKKNINEAQLDFHYLTSPEKIEKKLNVIGLDNYLPIAHSKIFFDISDFINIQHRMSNLKKINEE